MKNYCIDAHQHFWQYSPERHSWISDEMNTLQQDFLPAELQKIYAQNHVDGCIAVQAEQSEAETQFLLQLAEQNDFIKGVVGWVDLRDERVEERLEYFSTFPKLRGIRHIVQDEPDTDFMLTQAFQHGISCLEKYGLTYDILIYPHQFPAALQTIDNFPNQKFVINHLAKPHIRKGIIGNWEVYMEKAAQYNNVWCKVSGMVTEADWRNWEYANFVPFLDIAFNAFDPSRLMYGSDWPVCLLAGSYANVKGILQHYSRTLSTEDQEKLWWKNAAEFYGIEN